MSKDSSLLDADRESSNQRHTFNVECDSGDTYTLVGRPCELSAFSFVPHTRKWEPRERNVFDAKNCLRRAHSHFDYDNQFNVRYDFNTHIHRCDRQHAKSHGLDVWNEEMRKVIPSRSSLEYGRKVTHLLKINDSDEVKVSYGNYLEPVIDRKYARIGRVQSEFYSRNGINDLNKQNKSFF